MPTETTFTTNAEYQKFRLGQGPSLLKDLHDTIERYCEDQGTETESWQFVGERKCSPREMKLLASSMIAMGGASAVRVFKSRRGGSGKLVYEAVSD